MFILKMNSGMIYEFKSYQALLDHIIIRNAKHDYWLMIGEWKATHHVIQEDKLVIKTTFSDEPIEIGQIYGLGEPKHRTSNQAAK